MTEAFKGKVHRWILVDDNISDRIIYILWLICIIKSFFLTLVIILFCCYLCGPWKLDLIVIYRQISMKYEVGKLFFPHTIRTIKLTNKNIPNSKYLLNTFPRLLVNDTFAIYFHWKQLRVTFSYPYRHFSHYPKQLMTLENHIPRFKKKKRGNF